MNSTISLVLTVIGIGLIVFGITAVDSVSSDISRLFTGAPTDKAIWLLLAGTLITIAGFGGIAFGSHSAKA